MKPETLQTALDALRKRHYWLSQYIANPGGPYSTRQERQEKRDIEDAIADIQQALASEKDTPTEAIAE